MSSVRRKFNSDRYAKLFKFMLANPTFTYEELQLATGLSYEAVQQFISSLRELKVVRVFSWRADDISRFQTMVFEIGKGKDAMRPPPLTGAARQAQYKARKNANAQLIAQQAILSLGRVGSSCEADADALHQHG